MSNLHVSDLTPGKGERVITIGGTRAGKSAVQDMTARHIQLERPSAMQALVDSKPRYRAEKERGKFRRGRRSAAYRYETWDKGPVVPNSVVVDIWDDKPFESLFSDKYPGEIAILQSGEAEDWKRILELLRGFVSAQIKGRERRIIVDECLDFTHATPWELTRKTTCSTGQRERERNVESVSISARTECMVFRRSSFTCSPASTCFTYARMMT